MNTPILKSINRDIYKKYIIGVVEDTFIYETKPTSIELDNGLFSLFLENKRFIVDILQVDTVEDYINVYLFGVKQPQSKYNVNYSDNTISIKFIENITRIPEKIIVDDFIVKGKFTDIV